MVRSSPEPNTAMRRPTTALFAAMVFTATLVGSAVPGAWAAPPLTLDVRPWDESLLPPIYPPGDKFASQVYPPDSLGSANRARAFVHWAERVVAIDGDLAEWRLERWYDIAGPQARLAGDWHGDADLAVRFAMQWNAGGVWFAAQMRDDSLSAPSAPGLERESVTLALASESHVVQRYWMGGSRSLRVRADGRLEAWTLLRNKRREPFDATALGVRAAVRRDPAAAGRLDFELFIPWAALYPAFPRADAKLLCNVMADDFEAGIAKRVAWSVGAGAKGRLPSWGIFDATGGPGPDTWFTIPQGPYAESLCEWLVVPPTGAAHAHTLSLEFPTGALRGTRPLRAAAPHQPFFACVRSLPGAKAVSGPGREFSVDVTLTGATSPVQRSTMLLAPSDEMLGTALATAEAAALGDTSTAFPAGPDVVVRFQRARRDAAALGVWDDRKFHPTGILAYRMAAWSAVEANLDEAEVLAGVRRGEPAAVARLAELWPQRVHGNLPVDTVLLRGHRSSLDGSVQPFTMFVPHGVASQAPLLVALHDLDQNESALFDNSTLAVQCQERGWIAVCPYGRGNSGYTLAGERDVLEVLQAVRADGLVDARRLYLTGDGMGGTGTWLLALRHPGLFAAANPIAAYGDLDQSDIFKLLEFQPAERGWFDAHNPVRLLRAAPRTAFRIVHGEHDAVVSPVHARIMDARLKELGIAHEFVLDQSGDHGPRFFDAQLNATGAFLAAHTLATGGAPNAALFASNGGPLCDVFARGPFAIVYGTRTTPAAAADTKPAPEAIALHPPQSDATTARQVADEWRRRFLGEPRLIADSALTEPMAQSMNLLLVGTPDSNSWIARWASRLPVRWEDGAVIVNNKGYRAEKFGVAVAVANPEFPGRSLVLCTAMQDRIAITRRSLFTAGSDTYIVTPAAKACEIGPLLGGP